MDSDSVRGRDSGSRSNIDIPYPLHRVSFAGICSAGKKRNFMTQPLRLTAVWLTELTSWEEWPLLNISVWSYRSIRYVAGFPLKQLSHCLAEPCQSNLISI